MPSSNSALAKIFDDMAAALELTGANPFRVNAHSRVARLLADLPDDVESLVRNAADEDAASKRLQEIPGVGEGSSAKIIEFVNTGRIKEHADLLKKVPKGLFDLLAIPGLGPKKVKLMWDQLGITSVEQLKKKLDTPDLFEPLHMGAKTIDNIRKALAFAETASQRLPIGLARPVALSLVDELKKTKGVKRIDYAGSLRRGKETIGDVDLLASTSHPESLRDRFCTLPTVTQVLARGESKCSVRLDIGGLILQADLRIIPDSAYGAALMYFTGSKEHNVALRELAIKKNMRLNEYGLFKGTEDRPQDSGAKPLAADTEEHIYSKLGLPCVPPELREDGWQFDADHPPPKLIELDDIKAELHAHTTASDGKLSIDELAACAKKRGFHTLAVTDHSVSSVIANGLSPDRLRKHIDAIRAADDRIKGITLLAGAEVDILADGRLDYDDETLALLDVVVASPHASLRQDSKTATDRLLRAIRHPLVHIIGHPTGRMVAEREGLEPDMNALFEAAAQHKKALEINANWRRLDLRDSHVRAALAHDCLIAVDTDAHAEKHFDFLVYGILTGRRAGLTASSCINTWPAKKLHDWLKSKRK